VSPEFPVDKLAKGIAAHTEEGIRQRLNHALETRKSAGQSVQDGRKYVEAYVTFVHYVERIAQVVHGAPHPAETGLPERTRTKGTLRGSTLFLFRCQTLFFGQWIKPLLDS
jgi:hypothetical protein